MTCGLRAGPAFPGSRTALAHASDPAWAAGSQVQFSSSTACSVLRLRVTKSSCNWHKERESRVPIMRKPGRWRPVPRRSGQHRTERTCPSLKSGRCPCPLGVTAGPVLCGMCAHGEGPAGFGSWHSGAHQVYFGDEFTCISPAFLLCWNFLVVLSRLITRGEGQIF